MPVPPFFYCAHAFNPFPACECGLLPGLIWTVAPCSCLQAAAALAAIEATKKAEADAAKLVRTDGYRYCRVAQRG